MDRNEEMLEALRGLIAIDSVAGRDVAPEAPYGTGPARAVSCALELCARLGMRVTNRENQVAYAEIGQGEEIVGILAHLDIVPAGDGWKYDPFSCTVEDGKIYGRGLSDDKGPAVACIFAMKDLLDAGAPLRRRIRILFGQSEETGAWADMEYYREHEELPVFGFTPDADFPAIYGEKGIVCFDLSMPLERSGLLSIEGGSAINMVPGWCRASYPGGDGKAAALRTEGREAHASTPEKGDNAITGMMELLNGRIDSPLVDFYREHIGRNLNGQAMGCALEDGQSGKLTMNVGTVRTENGRVILAVDVRNPVTFTAKEVLEPVRAAAEPYGFEVKLTEDLAPVYMDKNGKVIESLLSVYREATGDHTEPTVIGGGTYARAMKNIVAFGPMFPGRELTEHQKNEYLLAEDFYAIRDIYRAAMEKLANLD